MIPARWTVAAPPDPGLTSTLAADLHIPEPLAAILVQRGLAAPDLAKAFLRPELERLSDPLAWADMARAVDLIVAAVRARAPILVHGDYDVDGQCGAALLTRVLSSVGGNVRAFVPHRLRDGYDFGPAGLAEAQRVGARLVITCDCGITAVETVGAARAAGIDVIVTDHHLPGDVLPPATAVLDPRRADCASEDKHLCGTGVVFKLAQALVPALGLSPNLPLHFLDLVALATVADVVPLTGENRILVRHGLKMLADSRWTGVRALIDAAGRGGLRPPRRAAARGAPSREIRRAHHGGGPHDPPGALRGVSCCVSRRRKRASAPRRPGAGAAGGPGAATGPRERRAGEADPLSRAVRRRQSGARVRGARCPRRGRAPGRHEPPALHAGRRVGCAAGHRVPVGRRDSRSVARRAAGRGVPAGARRVAGADDTAGAGGGDGAERLTMRNAECGVRN